MRQTTLRQTQRDGCGQTTFFVGEVNEESCFWKRVFLLENCFCYFSLEWPLDNFALMR
jgi:hypothetical protein